MLERGKYSQTSGGIEDITNGFSTAEKQNDCDEARPLQRNDRVRRESLAKIELQINPPGKEPTVKPKRTYGTLMENLKMKEKRSLPFLLAIVLCVLLLITLIILVAFWPQIPYYMKAEICVDKECMDASKQILTWANTSANVCEEPYEWACGKFEKEYEEHTFYGIHKGEWNMESTLEYEEIRDLNLFISMLPSNELSYSSASILKSLYKSCREIETMDKSQADTLLRKAIKSLGGWRALREGKGLQTWDYRKALTYLQSVYGAFPFFKISVAKRLNPPYGNIIFIHEGETGLPHKIFYNLENNNKITNAYKMLLRDFALNMGVVGEESELFADAIFHYEKRIVNQIILTEKSSNSEDMVLKKLGELKKIAPSLPVFETIQAIFSKTKITEETEVLVQNSNILQAMSIIVSTSDKQPLNDFIIWAMARAFLPYLSREYNVLVDKYEQALYGFKAVTPKWYFCTAAVRNMMSFAVDALQENSTLISTDSLSSPEKYNNSKQKLLFGDELFKLMFYHIRNEVQLSLKNSAEINDSNRTFIIEKLSNIKLQIGLPDTALESSTYIQEYYEDFLLQNLFFAEHLESFWNFKKVRMEKSLKPPRLVDLIIAELYSNERHRRIAFSPSINMAIVSRRLLRPSYFNYKYPIAFNFARVGSDIAEFFLESISLYLTQENQNTSIALQDIFHINCLKKQIIEQHTTLSVGAGAKLYNKVIAAKITFSALNSFLHAVHKSDPILGAPLSEVTYAELGLKNDKRQPGLRYLFEQQYFALAILQNHCSVSNEIYSQFKPFIRDEISESKMFYTLWNYVPYLSNSLYCSPERSKCFKIL